MAEDDALYSVLMRFHQEVVRPELNEPREELRGEIRDVRARMVTRDEWLSYLDDIYAPSTASSPNISRSPPP